MINKLLCYFDIRHRYYVIKEYSKDIRKVGCRHCSKTWGMNDRARAFIPWDDELQKLHEGHRA